MAFGADQFLKKTLGEDFLESLAKVELWKPGTRTTLDHEEIKTALKIVPRTVMALLIRELAPMKVGEHKDIPLPVGNQAMLKVDKHERDVYSGSIDEENKFVVDFKFRSLPGIGLVILSAFEMYDVESLKDEKHPEMADGVDEKVQKLIDERLALHSLITSVVEQKVSQREAITQLMLLKLTEELQKQKEIQAERKVIEQAKEAPAQVNVEINVAPEKKYPLKDFLDKRANKKVQGFDIHMSKGETVDCPDCKKNIFDGKLFSGCICLGDDREKKIFIKKTEEGINVRFSKGWDEENIEMLLDVLRKKHG